MESGVSHKPEEVVVIGGGLEGCLAAIFAARVKDDQGRPKYKVTLLEAKNKILGSATQLAARLHLGGEYPKNFETAQDCLWGAAIWKLILPEKPTFTDQPPMRFLVAKATQDDPHSGLTLESYIEHYEKVKREYAHVIDFIHESIKKADLKDERAQWTKDDVAHALFGKPEDFYHKLKPEDLEPFRGEDGKLRVEGGIQSQEPGLNIDEYLRAISFALKESGVTIQTLRKVEDIESHPDAPQRYTVHCKHGISINADRIIQAAWESGIQIDGRHRKPEQHKKVQVYRRAMVLVDTTGLKNLPSPCFVLKDDAGGMFCPINDNIAFVYHPTTSHIDQGELDSAQADKRSLPPAQEAQWQLALPGKKGILRNFKQALVDKGPLPFLKDANFRELRVRTTLNFQQSVDERRHEPTREIEPGYCTMYATKLTLAPQSAIEAVEMLKARTALKEAGRGEEELPPFEPHMALQKALRDPTYQLQDLIHTVLTKPVSTSAEISEFPPSSSLPTWASGVDYTRSNAPLAGAITSTSDKSRRSFGQGFGPHKISVYTEEGPKTGAIFHKDAREDAQTCMKIREWAESDDSRPLSSIITPKELAAGFQNRMLHADMLEIMDVIINPQWRWPDSAYRKLFSKHSLTHFPEDASIAMHASRRHFPEMKRLPFLPRSRNHISKRDKVPLETTVVAMPILFSQLSEADQEIVSRDMAVQMNKFGSDKAFFKPLGDPGLNHLVIRKPRLTPHTKLIYNNGRTIQANYQPAAHVARADPDHGYLQFQGQDFYPVQFHFHRNRNIERDAAGDYVRDEQGNVKTAPNITDTNKRPDGAFEFRLYKNRQHELRCKKKKDSDPNDDSVGELHAIYMNHDLSRDGIRGYYRALLIGTHVKLGPKNEEFDKYLKELRGRNSALAEGEGVVPAKLRFDPLACFNQSDFTRGTPIPEAPFVSTKLGHFEINSKKQVILTENSNSPFYRGVHVIHMPESKSITISPEQLDELEKLQPRLIPLPSRTYVAPIPRFMPKDPPRHGGR